MKPALVDIAVLILFFNRPKQLEAVFRQVRQARPSRLFLYQDGPRNENDLPGIQACREVVAQIDWECEAHQLYQEKNYGCDPSEFISQKWAFSLADKCIVLEDDDVPALSFFPFCKEMLDKYEHDTRISMIAGFNPEEVSSDVPYDYFFASTFSIWGWASWKRVVDQWDEHYSFLDDSFNMRQLQQLIKERKYRDDFIYMCQRHRENGKAYYETIFHASMLFNSGLAIVPTRNMINNLGVTSDSTHFAGSVHTLPRAYRRIFTMQRHELMFPLKHPRYVIENVAYKQSVYRIMCWGHPWRKVARSLEELFLNLRYGNFRLIGQAVRKRWAKWMKQDKHL
ncbi:MAG: hemolysin activation protein [Bacteroides sp.]|nr:hemolysin activation protein [Bacteroides sp.]